MPALEREPLLDPARPVIGRRVVVDHDHGQRLESDAARVLHGLPVRALVELAVADEHVDAPAGQRAPDRDREAVAERAAPDLGSGNEQAIRVVTERRVEGAEAVQELEREHAFRR